MRGTDQITNQEVGLSVFGQSMDADSTSKKGNRTTSEQRDPGYNFQCGECGACFMSASTLSDHWQTSHKACRLCGAQFDSLLELKRHKESSHSQNRALGKPFICCMCGQQFSKDLHLHSHVNERHKIKQNVYNKSLRSNSSRLELMTQAPNSTTNAVQ